MWRTLAPLFRPHGALLAVGLGGSLAGALARVLAPLAVARGIDAVGSGDRDAFRFAFPLFLAALAADVVASVASRMALEVVTQRALFDLKDQLFQHLLGQDVAFHDRTPPGSLIGRIQGDADALRVLFVEVLFVLPSDLAMALGVVLLVLVDAPAVALPVLLVIPAYVAWFALFRAVAPPAFAAHRLAAARLTATLAETVRTLPFLASQGHADWALARAGAQVAEMRAADVRGHFQPIWYYNGALVIRAAAIVGVLLAAAARVDAGAAAVGDVVLGLAYVRQLFNPLMRLSNQLGLLERARAAAVRIDALLAEQPAVRDAPDAGPWPGLRAAVRFEGVSFGYTPDRPVIEGLDLEVPAGTRLGVVGPTGSGKSTLLDLLLRFRDPTAGRVTVDGVPLDRIRIADLRAHTGLVLQDVRLLRGTVHENLGGGDPTAARRALDAVGLDWPLARTIEDGALSRGERQLLTLARALVNDPALLVLDEATSSVDPGTEALLEAALDHGAGGRTLVIVAHRLETVRRCDRIVVFEAGRVIESGTHDALLARNGRYAAYVSLQGAA